VYLFSSEANSLLIRPYCVATEEGERATADPSLRCAPFRMTASGDAILSGRINKKQARGSQGISDY
jgi:hypothetical protein